MKIGKIKFGKIKLSISKFPRKMAERAFITFLGFLVLFLIFGAILFYKYVFLAQNAEPDILDESVKFNEKLFQEISQGLTERDENFKSADSKQYPDPFLRPPAGEVPGEGGELTP